MDIEVGEDDRCQKDKNVVKGENDSVGTTVEKWSVVNELLANEIMDDVDESSEEPTVRESSDDTSVDSGCEVFQLLFQAMEEVSAVLNEMKQISGKLRKLVNLCEKETDDSSVDSLKTELETSSENVPADSSVVNTVESIEPPALSMSQCLPLATQFDLSSSFPVSPSTICGDGSAQTPFEHDNELTEEEVAGGGESLCERYKLIQTTLLPLLVLRLRQLNRYMCISVKNCGEVVENDSEALAHEKQKLTNQLYQLAWLRRTAAGEESYRTVMWDQVRNDSTTDEQYERKFASQPGFVSKQEDERTFTLNLLQFEMEERLRGKAQLDAVRTSRSKAEQRLAELRKQEVDIQKSLGKLADAVHEIHCVCQQAEPLPAEDTLSCTDSKMTTVLEPGVVSS
eukprot:GHVS01047950.1.p1 GENE.GHVS01047950.1~~GHVS01047950.1.p1  ORF type:complete len:398 (-),score=62.91 GHVS01047950.1:318-1511(-)